MYLIKKLLTLFYVHDITKYGLQGYLYVTGKMIWFSRSENINMIKWPFKWPAAAHKKTRK